MLSIIGNSASFKKCPHMIDTSSRLVSDSDVGSTMPFTMDLITRLQSPNDGNRGIVSQWDGICHIFHVQSLGSAYW